MRCFAECFYYGRNNEWTKKTFPGQGTEIIDPRDPDALNGRTMIFEPDEMQAVYLKTPICVFSSSPGPITRFTDWVPRGNFDVVEIRDIDNKTVIARFNPYEGDDPYALA